MNKPHKYQKEIIAWVNGEKVQYRRILAPTYFPQWEDMDETRFYFEPDLEFRIKPPREYPKTSLTGQELINMFSTAIALSGDKSRGPNVFSDIACFNFANEVIRRFVDDQEGKE